MTKQEAFDTVAKHLFAQGKRSTTESGASCLYRSPDGLACAVGALIPDEYYRKDMEYQYASEITHQVPALCDLDGAFLDCLQRAHDDRENWNSDAAMRNALRRAARHHDLSPAILDTLSFNRDAP